MRLTTHFLLLGIASVPPLLVGCGSGSGSAEPVADVSEISAFLEDNPELNVDGLEDEDADVDLAE